MDATTTATAVNETMLSSVHLQKTQALLQSQSDGKALLFLPVIVFMVILMIIGVIGNAIVIYIYWFRYPSRSSNCFFITMAVFDLLACAIGMPIDIYDLRNHYTFYSAVACKLFRYVECITTYGSSIILVEIAFDRYLKICRPLEIGNQNRTKTMCVVALILAILMSIPALILFGLTHPNVEIKGLNITGSDCSIAEEYHGGSFPRIYYIILIVIFLVSFSLLAGLYIRIWVEIKRRKEMVIGDRLRHDDDIEGGKSIIKRPEPLSSVSDDDSSAYANKKVKGNTRTTSTSSYRSRMASLSEAMARMRVSRTTKIFIAVTLVFVLSYLPSIAVMVARSSYKRLETSASPVEELFLKLFSRFHFINNCINPIIYSFLNINFRKQCSKLLKSIAFCCIGSITDRSQKVSFRNRKNTRSRTNSEKSDRTRELEIQSLQEKPLSA